jgi:predicted transcriptional regulator
MLSENKHIYNIILEKAIKKQIDEIAKTQERSSSWLINNILKKWLEDSKKES